MRDDLSICEDVFRLYVSTATICVSSLRDVDTCRVRNVGGLSWGQCMHILEYKGCIMKIQISKDLKPCLGLPTKPSLTLSSFSKIRSQGHSQNTAGLIEHLKLQSLPPGTQVLQQSHIYSNTATLPHTATPYVPTGSIFSQTTTNPMWNSVQILTSSTKSISLPHPLLIQKSSAPVGMNQSGTAGKLPLN